MSRRRSRLVRGPGNRTRRGCVSGIEDPDSRLQVSPVPPPPPHPPPPSHYYRSRFCRGRRQGQCLSSDTLPCTDRRTYTVAYTPSHTQTHGDRGSGSRIIQTHPRTHTDVYTDRQRPLCVGLEPKDRSRKGAGIGKSGTEGDDFISLSFYVHTLRPLSH